MVHHLVGWDLAVFLQKSLGRFRDLLQVRLVPGEGFGIEAVGEHGSQVFLCFGHGELDSMKRDWFGMKGRLLVLRLFRAGKVGE
jgi:hypothetical protein